MLLAGDDDVHAMIHAGSACRGVRGGAAALAEVGLACGRALRARLVVGADGPRSHVRQLAGAH